MAMNNSHEQRVKYLKGNHHTWHPNIQSKGDGKIGRLQPVLEPLEPRLLCTRISCSGGSALANTAH